MPTPKFGVGLEYRLSARAIDDPLNGLVPHPVSWTLVNARTGAVSGDTQRAAPLEIVAPAPSARAVLSPSRIMRPSAAHRPALGRGCDARAAR